MNNWILRTDFHKETGIDAEVQNEQGIGTTDNESWFPFSCKYVRWLEEYIINLHENADVINEIHRRLETPDNEYISHDEVLKRCGIKREEPEDADE